jgi:hypothetical protein
MRAKLTTAGLLLCASFGAAAEGRAAESDAPAVGAAPSTRRVALSVGGAAIVGVGLPDFTAAGGLALGLREDWAVVSRLRLGLAQSVTMASLPYGSNDGEPAPLRRTGGNPTSFSPDTSFPTRVVGIATVDLDRVQIDAGVGAVFLLSSTMGGFSLFPGLVAQAGVAVPLGPPGTRLSLRLDVWRVSAWGMQAGQSVVVPELGLDVRL